MVAPGQPAPDFALKNAGGEVVTLAEFRGRNVVLFFHPFAFSSICQDELCALRDDAALADLDAQVISVSCDSRFVLGQWAKEQGYTFPLLSDFWPHGEAARAYGVFDENAGAARRVSFVIDKQGVVAERIESDSLGTAREHAAYAAALARLP